MIHIARWKKILVLIVCAFGLLYSLPNVIGQGTRDYITTNLPGFVPSKTVNLGLDLQGGSHLLLEVDLDTVIEERAEALVSALRPELRNERIGYRRLNDLDGGVRVELRDEADVGTVRKMIRDLDNQLDISVDGMVIEGRFSDLALKEIQDQTISQSIEIVRCRIDETGTREPAIQRQGDDRILVQLPGLDDPTRIKELLGTTAKLSFHLVDMDGRGAGTMTLPLADRPGETITINRRSEITGDMLVNAAYAQDQNGGSAVSFRFNSVCLS